MISLHEFLDTCYWKLHCMYTNFCLKNLCCHRVRFEIGPYSCSYSFVTLYVCVSYLYWYICSLWLVCLQCWMFVVRYQCCLNPTWERFGIMLMTLTGWFDIVLGSDVTMYMGYLFMTSFCNTNIVSSCENYNYILIFFGSCML